MHLNNILKIYDHYVCVCQSKNNFLEMTCLSIMLENCKVSAASLFFIVLFNNNNNNNVDVS